MSDLYLVPTIARPLRTRAPQAGKLLRSDIHINMSQETNALIDGAWRGSCAQFFPEPTEAPRSGITNYSTWYSFALPSASGATLNYGFPWWVGQGSSNVAMGITIATKQRARFIMRIFGQAVYTSSASNQTGQDSQTLTTGGWTRHGNWRREPYRAQTTILNYDGHGFDPGDFVAWRPQIQLVTTEDGTIDDGETIEVLVTSAFIQESVSK